MRSRRDLLISGGAAVTTGFLSVAAYEQATSEDEGGGVPTDPNNSSDDGGNDGGDDGGSDGPVVDGVLTVATGETVSIDSETTADKIEIGTDGVLSLSTDTKLAITG